VNETVRTLAFGFGALAAGFTWLTARTTAIPASSPERLVAELRLAQMAALVLTLVAGAYVGFAVAHETEPGVGMDIALAIGFLIVAGVAMLRDPREALTLVALAFGAHALLDVAHRPGMLPADMAPRWYAIACAVYDVYLVALCYLPVLRR
jgi:hypothetical protein